MDKVLIINTDRCTGCRVCEIACSMAKYGESNPNKSFIKVLRNKEMDINLVALNPKCNFCGECIDSCLPRAIEFVDSNEAIIKWKGIKVGSLPAPLIGGR